MKHFLYLLCLNLLWVGCMSNIPMEKIKEVSINIYAFTSMRGDKINYCLFIPYDYNPNTSSPLVLFHHGAGGRGNDNIKNLEGDPCDKCGNFTIYKEENQLKCLTCLYEFDE